MKGRMYGNTISDGISVDQSSPWDLDASGVDHQDAARHHFTSGSITKKQKEMFKSLCHDFCC